MPFDRLLKGYCSQTCSIFSFHLETIRAILLYHYSFITLQGICKDTCHNLIAHVSEIHSRLSCIIYEGSFFLFCRNYQDIVSKIVSSRPKLE